jgi:hypothetical protein
MCPGSGRARGLAELERRFDGYGVEPVVEAEVEDLAAVRTPADEPCAVAGDFDGVRRRVGSGSGEWFEGLDVNLGAAGFIGDEGERLVSGEKAAPHWADSLCRSGALCRRSHRRARPRAEPPSLKRFMSRDTVFKTASRNRSSAPRRGSWGYRSPPGRQVCPSIRSGRLPDLPVSV